MSSYVNEDIEDFDHEMRLTKIEEIKEENESLVSEIDDSEQAAYQAKRSQHRQFNNYTRIMKSKSDFMLSSSITLDKTFKEKTDKKSSLNEDVVITKVFMDSQ